MTSVALRSAGLLLTCLLLLLSPDVARAQSREQALTDFDFVLEVIRRDYAGYPDKTAGPKTAEFDALVLSKRAQLERNPGDEAVIISDVLAWFRDRHVGYAPVARPGQLSSPAADDARLAAQGPFFSTDGLVSVAERAKQPLAGTTWASVDGNYQAVIMPDPANATRALGIVTSSKSASWSRGQLKFALSTSGRDWSGTYYMRDHREEQVAVTSLGKGSVLRFGNLSIDWVRVRPAPEVPLDRIIPSSDFFLRRLSEKTAVLRLPNFYRENRAQIEKLLDDNRTMLENTPNLIIDARNNGGGSDEAYNQLMKLLYTRPIYTIGVEFRASPRNADLYETMLQDPSFRPETVARLRRIVTRMREAKAEWVYPGDKPFAITTYPRVMPNPKRVGIIATGAGSSGDQFVLDARQSRKVTTFGGPTSGVIDYSNVLEATAPSKLFVLSWATSRSMRLPDEPIDNIGILPDIAIGSHVDDPIGFVQSWLERQVD